MRASFWATTDHGGARVHVQRTLVHDWNDEITVESLIVDPAAVTVEHSRHDRSAVVRIAGLPAFDGIKFFGDELTAFRHVLAEARRLAGGGE